MVPCSERPVALRLEQAEADSAELPDLREASHRLAASVVAQHPARPSAVARQARAQQLAVPRRAVPRRAEPLRRQVGLRPAEPAVQAGVAAQQQEVQPASAAQPQAARAELAVLAAAALQPAAVSVAVVRRPEEGVAVLDVVEAALPQAAVRAAVVAGRLREGAAPDVEAGPLRAAAVRDEGGLLREAQGAPAGRPSAAAWAGAPLTRFPGDRLAPSPWARSAHARESLRIAQP
jgi:hypothetical protein